MVEIESVVILKEIQLRMVTGLEVNKLIIRKVNGAEREPKYTV